jgi:hypothetical protein
MVRKNHAQTHGHWMFSKLEINKLKIKNENQKTK